MSSPMQIDDEIRIQILEALLQKGAVVPNMRQLKKHTGYHLATIKSSLDFLQKNSLLEGYGPKINFRKLGYILEATVMMQADTSQKATFQQFIKSAQNDPHLYRLSPVIGAGTFNMMARHFYKDIESYHQNVQKNYFEAIPGYFNMIKDRQVFYSTEPAYKRASRTEAILEIIKRDKGYT